MADFGKRFGDYLRSRRGQALRGFSEGFQAAILELPNSYVPVLGNGRKYYSVPGGKVAVNVMAELVDLRSQSTGRFQLPMNRRNLRTLLFLAAGLRHRPPAVSGNAERVQAANGNVRLNAMSNAC